MTSLKSYDKFFDDKNEIQKVMKEHDECDIYDYLMSVGSGCIGGVVDVFLVGSSKYIGALVWTDKQIDTAICNISKFYGWNDSGNVQEAIKYLEKKRKGGEIEDFRDVTKLIDVNYYIKSMASTFDPLGLFFSILEQFKGGSISSSYNGPVAKIYFGVVNWFKNIISNISDKVNTGLVMPFQKILQLFGFSLSITLLDSS